MKSRRHSLLELDSRNRIKGAASQEFTISINSKDYVFTSPKFDVRISEIPSNFYKAFYKNTYITEISDWTIDMSQVTSIASMFSECKNLKYINVSSWDLSNVTSVYNWAYNGVFSNCINLASKIDTSNWNLNKVTELSTMFYLCYKIPEINLNGIKNTENITSFVSDIPSMHCIRNS